MLTRRMFGQRLIAGVAASAWPCSNGLGTPLKNFGLRFIVASSMYGSTPFAEVLGEVHKTGSTAIDVWSRPHATHREQLDKMGQQRFRQLLLEHQVELGALTRYDLGPHALRDEIRLLAGLGGGLVICGAVPQPGDSLKSRVARFIESMKPHADFAQQHGVTIGIENHAGNLLSSPEAVRYFADLAPPAGLGLALAPYHLPQDARLLASLIKHLDRRLVFFQAWQHGAGSAEGLPTEQLLLQLPGRGTLDFTPVLGALRDIDYSGWTEIFMHPSIRGTPIRGTTEEVTAEINRSRMYLETCLERLTLSE